MKPILMNNNTIIKGHVSKDHIHVLVSATTSLSMSRLVPKLKGASSHKLFQEYAHLRK
jgi:putative transposase